MRSEPFDFIGVFFVNVQTVYADIRIGKRLFGKSVRIQGQGMIDNYAAFRPFPDFQKSIVTKSSVRMTEIAS